MVANIVDWESEFSFFTKETRTLKPSFMEFHSSKLEVSTVDYTESKYGVTRY
jgi:hypothetical protein